MRHILKGLLVVTSLTTGGAASAQCAVESALRGNAEAFEIKNEWDGKTYSTYLVRNADRDDQGVLRQAILYEISSQRWGFDLRSPNDRLLAQIRKEAVGDDGRAYTQWVIEPYLDHEQACAGRKFVLQRVSSTKVRVVVNGATIGTIDKFPFHEAF